MEKIILGWILIITGVFTLIAGIYGGIIKMQRDLQNNRSKGTKDLEPTTSFIIAITELLSTLIKAPLWLALSIIGILLIAWGGSLIF